MKVPGLDRLRRGWWRYHLAEPELAFMADPPPPDEWVSLDCETTGLNVRRDRIISIAAVRIVGQRLMTSERLELLVRPERAISADAIRVHQLRHRDVAHGLAPQDAIRQLLNFIGSRPIVGYYLEFDMAMIHREAWPMLGVRLPQPRIDVSTMFYDYQNRRLRPDERGGRIDLRFATIMDELALPTRHAHDALNDAVMTGLAFVKLRRLLAQR